jgi:hypothetical protein
VAVTPVTSALFAQMGYELLRYKDFAMNYIPHSSKLVPKIWRFRNTDQKKIIIAKNIPT